MDTDRSCEKFRVYGSWFVLIIWLILTLVAISGMYHLWWTRERILYMGKDLHEQRVEVFHRAGIAEPLLNAAEQIMVSWPRDIRYSAQGDHNQLSYVKYLLIPRIPSMGTVFSLEEKDRRLLYHPILSKKDKPIEIQSSLYGLLLSLFLLSGIALLLRLGFRVPFLSIPEYAGMAVFILAGLVIASRGFLGEATTGFWFIAVAGFVGWIIHIPSLYNVMRTFMRRILQFVTDLLCKKSTNHKIPYFLPALLAAIAMAVLFWSILMSVVVVPDDWDAWAIWGAKAKVLALGWGPLKDATAFGHPDYPLLWPAVWAFAGWCSGGWEEHWTRAWGPIFMILSAWQIGVAIRRLTEQRGLGWIGAVLFLSMPMVPLLASWSYAEAPLWLFVTCAFGRLLMWRKEKVNHHLLIAALFAVAAAYTKNEGLFFAAVCIVWLVTTAPRSAGIYIGWYALPIVLLYLPWFLWVRGALQLGARAFDGFKGGTAAAIRALERLPDALQSICVMWVDIRQWNLVVWIVLILSLWHLLRGGGRRMDLFVPLIMLLAFLTINVFHEENLGLIMSSWNRLTVQTLPMFIMVLGVHYLPAALGKNHS